MLISFRALINEQARTYFSMVPFNSKLVFFGGFGDSKGRFNDLRTFDTSKLAAAGLVYFCSDPMWFARITQVAAAGCERFVWFCCGDCAYLTRCSGEAPRPVYLHTAVVYNNQMW